MYVKVDFLIMANGAWGRLYVIKYFLFMYGSHFSYLLFLM